MSNRAARAIPSVIRGVFGGRLSTGAIHPYPYVRCMFSVFYFERLTN